MGKEGVKLSLFTKYEYQKSDGMYNKPTKSNKFINIAEYKQQTIYKWN